MNDKSYLRLTSPNTGVQRLFRITLFLGVLLVLSSCKDDRLEPECDGSSPTYDGQIQSIIQQNCNASSCHGSGSNNGDFTTYAGLQPYLNNGNGSFRQEVLQDQTMPKGASNTLTQNELNAIQCWVENGYPEN